MIQSILNAIAPAQEGLLKKLCWLETYGGLAKVATKYISTESGVYKFTIPTSCTAVGDECFNPTNYLPMAPDVSKKSLFDFLPLGNLESAPMYNKGRPRSAKPPKWTKNKIKLRLYVWLNYPALGFGNPGCGMCEAVLSDLLNCFQYCIKLPEDSPYVNAVKKIKFNYLGTPSAEQIERDVSRYSYKDEIKLWSGKDYELCAYDFELCYNYNPYCLDPIICAEDPIVCP